MRLLTRDVKILATGSAAPDTVRTNAEIIDGLPTSDEWIIENLGIRERRIADGGADSIVLLAATAARNALQSAGLDPDQIDGIIVATSTPALRAPSTACLVQDALGVTSGSFAFDVQAVCSGFIYGLGIASTMITSRAAERLVVIGADVFSTITDWTDRSCVFFGDGAGAVVVGRDEESAGLMSTVLRADGRGHEGFCVPRDSSTFRMNPRSVYEAGVEVLPGAINEALQLAGLTIDDVAMVVPHQPSRRVLDETARRLKLPSEKMRMNMSHYANTAGATVPLLLDQTLRAGLVRGGDHLVLAAVGSGWTWGATVYRWSA